MMKTKNLNPIIIFFILTNSLFAQSTIDVKHYEAKIHFNLSDSTISGDATLTIANTTGQILNKIGLKLRDLMVSRADDKGTPTTFNQNGEDLNVNLSSPLQINSETSIRLIYSGKPTAEPPPSSWGGFFFGNPTFTMGVSFGTSYVSMTRHWLPSNDVPSDKATFDLTYIIPNGYAAAGTGVLQSMTAVGKDSVAYRWIENHQTATYLVTLAIGTYSRIKDTWNGIPCEYFVMKKDSIKGTTFFSTIPGMMECFTNVYGKFPFDKIGYCMTPIGAMEHQTMISYPQQYLEYYQSAENVAAHELSHQWWGDCVTPKDFREAWLSEGFATYSEALYAEYLRPNIGYWNSIKSFISNYVNQVAPSEGTFPLYDFPRTAPSSNYPTTIYKKGASVLAMLRNVVGDSVFFHGLKKYGQQFSYGNVTSDDFRLSIESEYSSDLRWFFDEWVFKAGYPEYSVQTWNESTGNPFRFRLVQNQDIQKYPLFTMPIDIDIITTNKDTLHYRITNKAIKTEDFSFPSIPSNSVQRMIFDPKGVILKKITYQPVGIKNEVNDVPSFHLDQNYPNPIQSGNINSTSTQIDFTLDKEMHVMLDLYDTLGKKTKEFLSASLPAGMHTIKIDIRNLSAGSYFYSLHSNHETAVKKLIIN